MTRRWRIFAAILILALSIASVSFAEDTIELNLARGERWTIPEDRLGTCRIADDKVVALEGGELVGLKPGRTEVRLSGEADTLLRVLVLFTEAAPDPDADPAEPAG